MIRQGAQPRQGRPVRESGLHGVEMRPLKASNQVGVGAHAHVSMVPTGPRSTEVIAAENQGSSVVNSSVGPLTPDLRAAVSEALARVGLSDKDAAKAMGIDPGRWSRQKAGVEGHFIQLDRLALLPDAFHIEFNRIYGGMVGVTVAHRRIADLLRARVIELLGEVNSLAEQLDRMSA